MKEFLEWFVIEWLSLQFLFLVIALSLVIIKKRKLISIEIKRHKRYYLLLIIIFLTGLFIRSINIVHPDYVNLDAMDFVVQGAMINIEDRFVYFNEAPSLPTLISFLQKIIGYNPSSGVMLSVIFSSLSIILLFIFVQLLFKKHIVSLVSAILLCFSALHYEASLNTVTPPGVTTFFILLSMILFILSVRENKALCYIATGVVLGFLAQIYYIDVVLVMVFLMYLFILRRHKLFKDVKVYIMVLLVIVSVSPFVLLHNPLVFKFDFEHPIKSLVCIWYSNKCRYFVFENLFHEPHAEYAGSNEDLNNFKGQLLSYGSFLFWGNGRVSNDNYVVIGSKYENYNHKKNWIYILYTLFILTSILNKGDKKKVLLVLFFAGYFIAYSMYFDRMHTSLTGIETIFIIPLTSLGMVIFTNKLVCKKILRIIIGVLILIVLISPVFTERIIQKSFKTSIFNPENSGTGWERWWGSEKCGWPYEVIVDEQYYNVSRNVCKKVFEQISSNEIND